MKKYIIILLSCLINLSIYAQNKNDHKIDSLNQIIENTNNDSLKIQALLSLESMYFNSNPNKCLAINEQIQDLINSKDLSQLDSIQIKYFELSNAKSMSNTGVILMYKSEFEKAEKLYNEAHIIIYKYNDSKEKTTILNRLGILNYLMEEYDLSLKYLMESLKLAKENDYKENLAQIYANIGNVYKALSDFETTIVYYKLSLEISREIKSDFGIALNLNNIGVVYRNNGDLPRALDNFQTSLEMRKKMNDKRGIIQVTGNMVNIYMSYGNLNKCIEITDTLIKRAEEINDFNSITKAYVNLGLVYENIKDFEKAKETYDLALEYALKTKNKTSISKCYNNLGILFKINKEYDKAFDFFQKSINIKLEVEDLDGLCGSYINVSAIYSDLNLLDSALFYSHKALELSKEINSYFNYKLALYNAVVIFLKLDDYEIAEKHILTLLNLNQREIINNFHLLTDREKELFYLEMKEFFELFYSLSYTRKDKNPSITEFVYNTIIKNKGILLKSSTVMRNIILSSDDHELKKLYKEWLKNQKNISQSIEQGDNVDQLINKTDSLERVLIKKSNLFSEFNGTFDLTWKDVQKGLKNNEAAIEFIHFKDITDSLNRILYCALIVRSDSKYPEMVELFYEDDLVEILSLAKGNNQSSINKIYGNKKKHKNELYKVIWEPLNEYLKGIKSVYVSPSGLLHKISFSALSNDENIYLCEIYSINILTSSTNIVESKPFQLNNNFNIGVFGGIDYKTDVSGNQIWPYLEGSLIETEKINQLFKNKKYNTLYRNKSNATEEEFKKLIEEVQILHVATHGFFYPSPSVVDEKLTLSIDETEKDISFRGNTNARAFQYFVRNENPLMRSGIVFADANKIWDITEDYDYEDGVLTAQEVLSLDLRGVELIVLSACETGLGDIHESEGVYGLQRSFKMAGVKYIIMSLWQVPDKETAEFMISFYQQLIKTKNIHQSFTFTQDQMRKKYDPYYWAAFVLME